MPLASSSHATHASTDHLTEPAASRWRRLPLPRGRVMGGPARSTACFAMPVSARLRSVGEMGASGWSLPCPALFRKSEARGAGWPYHGRRPGSGAADRLPHLLHEQMMATAGHPASRSRRSAGAQPEDCPAATDCGSRGRRVSAATAYRKPRPGGATDVRPESSPPLVFEGRRAWCGDRSRGPLSCCARGAR